MNLALLRVCSIALIANGLNNIAGILLQLFTSRTEGEPFFSNYGLPILLCGIFVIVAAIALVKKTPLLLKILSVIAIISSLVGAITYTVFFYNHILSASIGYSYLLEKLANTFVNASFVVWIAVFFIDRAITNSKQNLGLLQFCATFFIVNAINCLVNMIMSFFTYRMNNPEQPHSMFVIVMILIPVAAGIFSLVKKNALVLMAYSIITFVYLSWNTLDYVRENMFGGYYIWSAILGMLFNSFYVVCAATFFIDIEETKLYVQKAKSLFLRWKKLT